MGRKADDCRCPQGKVLRRQWRTFKIARTRVTKDGTILYNYCPASRLRDLPNEGAVLYANTPTRTIARSIHKSAPEVLREIAKTSGYKQSRKDRKKVEMLLAHLKRILRMDRLRLRGLSGARDEFLLAATAQNLRRMAQWLTPIAEKGDLAPA